MQYTGIHSIVISLVKVFTGQDLHETNEEGLVPTLFAKVNSERKFDSYRVEVITLNEDHFNFSGSISEPIPRFDEIISLNNFEISKQSSLVAEEFSFHASIRLSIAYEISEFWEYLEAAEEEGFEGPNLFSWIQYCIYDAMEALNEEIQNPADIATNLTIRGL